MEGTYFNNPTFPYAENMENNSEMINDDDLANNRENVNRLLNKDVKIYATFGNSMIWRDKIFEGKIKNFENHYIILLCGDDTHLLIPMNCINFIELKKIA